MYRYPFIYYLMDSYLFFLWILSPIVLIDIFNNLTVRSVDVRVLHEAKFR